MQTVVVLCFTFAAVLPVFHFLSEEQRLDSGVIKVIADAVRPAIGGGLNVRSTRELERVSADHPDFWFYAVDEAGDTVQLGDVPEHIQSLTSDITRISSANISNIGDDSTPFAIVRHHPSPVGRLWIITAGGPTLGPSVLLMAFSNPWFLGFILLLATTTMLTIPVFVGRQLRGVEALASEAASIDVDQPGVRLSAERVPTELHSMVQAVNDALERIDAGVARQQRFMADAAHELRTPIAILHTKLELLPDDEKGKQLLLDVARLSSMADQLLDLQRMDLSGMRLQKLDLVELASNVTGELAPLAIAAGDEIDFEAEADRIEVLGDSEALGRALTNVIQNAIAHGGEHARISVRVCRDARLQVADTGPGIDPSQLKEIFEPFHRVAPLRQGAGLGLSLVRDIVHRHNGRVVAGANEGGGALFEIRLPQAPAA
ncbi:two-component sensor histidine kinase [Devosia pacifica]|uniref:histidine kinase n=2 Tax=Devosia pacifica TaxID=1335967 RepID=A0A918S2R1_9HYPH|nr:two-component sensor histidine kinase [Devosia pacifica]